MAKKLYNAMNPKSTLYLVNGEVYEHPPRAKWIYKTRVKRDGMRVRWYQYDRAILFLSYHSRIIRVVDEGL